MASDYFDTRQLEAFVAVVSIGSMTGAARAIGRSQPAVSRLIQDLETEVGFPLLHRNGPRIAPTAQGVLFFGQAERLLAGMRTISELAREIASQAPSPIEIASIPALAASLVPGGLAGLERRGVLPHRVHVNAAASENVIQSVVSRTADLGLASLPIDNPGLEVRWLGSSPCVAVLRDDHPLATRDTLSLRDLRDERLIAPANPYRLRMWIDQALAAEGVVPQTVIDCNATYVSMSLARQGLGVAVVEHLTTIGLSVSQLRVIPLSTEVAFRWGLITALGQPLGPGVEILIEEICAYARRAVPDLTLELLAR